MAFYRPVSAITASWVVRMVIAYAAAILFLSSADFAFEWGTAFGATPMTRGVGLSVGYLGVWEVPTKPDGVKARLHTPDFGFAGPTLIARGSDGRVFLIAPWAVLAVAWFAHLAWALTRKRRA